MTRPRSMKLSPVLLLFIAPILFAQTGTQSKAGAAHAGMGHKMVTPDKVVWTQPPNLRKRRILWTALATGVKLGFVPTPEQPLMVRKTAAASA